MNILVLCTGNSCRSILAEALINDLGGDRFQAFSAGSNPTGTVNPGALQKLQSEGHRTDGFASKSWDAFSGDDAPSIDLVITVCDSAAGESCPVWRGTPLTVHWGIPDPADAPAAELAAAFDRAYEQLRTRIQALIELPVASMDARQLKDALYRIHDAASTTEQE
jgi:arsenate reductase